MFNKISSRYDIINHILSFGIDIQWRKNLVNLLYKKNINYIIDIATGTGDLAILSAKKILESKIVGIDFSKKMLLIGEKKIKKENLNNRIKMIYANSESIPFNNEHFDAATISFGIRNFENLLISLFEIYRILKHNGYLLILEFSLPSNSMIRKLYSIYNNYFMKFIGYILSKDKFAYYYLNKSILHFPFGDEIKKILISANFCEIEIFPLTLGIATIYIAKKK